MRQIVAERPCSEPKNRDVGDEDWCAHVGSDARTAAGDAALAIGGVADEHHRSRRVRCASTASLLLFSLPSGQRSANPESIISGWGIAPIQLHQPAPIGVS